MIDDSGDLVILHRLKLVLYAPRHLLLVDAIGALMTFCVTAFLLAPGWIPTGLPANALITLAFAAAVLFAFSWLGHLFANSPGAHLRGIAVLNAMYCMATIGLCIAHFSKLTIWGCLYFPAEVMLVLVLAWWEWSVSLKSKATVG